MKDYRKRIPRIALISVVLFFILTLSAFAEGTMKSSDNDFNGKKARYVFFFIGDGMGICQINSAEIYKGSIAGNEKKPAKLAMSGFPSQGLTTTYSADSFITDSAAAATALACGYKTGSGVVSMDTKKKEKFKTMAEMARDKGMKVGIVSSVSIDHATPACFYAHEASRGKYYEIACQMAESGFDYFAGGGPKGNFSKIRKDRKDVLEIMKEKGYTVVDNKEDFEKLCPKKNPKVMAFDKYLDGSFALYYDLDRKKDSISLAEFTKKGIELLDNDKGFFMMVEGGKIDWACHANDAGASIKDTLAFDQAVAEALEFYKKHPEETLIVVTGDHECGGMTVGFAGTRYSTFFEKIRHQKKSYLEFNKILGEYKKEHTGENASLSDLYDEIRDSFGLIADNSKDPENQEKEMVLTDYERDQLRDAFQRSMKGDKIKSRNQHTYLLYGGYEPLTVTLTHILNNKAGIGWTSYSHTAVPVPTFAIGPGHTLFNGYYDNTDVAKKIMNIML